MREFHSASEALHSFRDAFDIPKAIEDARSLRAQCDARGVQILAPNTPRYPGRLFSLEDAPNPLFALGDVELGEREKTVALVGSRRATSAGRHAAYRFAAALSAANVCVVSGLAAGIDSEAHTGALTGSGATIAVLGTGIDVPYPVANAPLHAAIARQGLVLSEHRPAVTAFAGAFPRRNRLIAALSDVVVVIEAGFKSGALITAQLADTLGRPVAALPGSIENAQCAGSNQLLRDGAHVVTSPDDVLAMLSLVPARHVTPAHSSPMRSSSSSALHVPSSSPPPASIEADVAQLPSRLRRDRSRPSGAPTRRATSRPDVHPSAALADALAAGQRAGVAESASGGAETPEQRILRVLDSGPQFSDDLVRTARAGAREVTTALSLLTVAGLVVIDASGLVRRR